MEPPRFDVDHGAVVIQQVMLERRRRLGTALQQLASDLAVERRRCADLEREINRLRRAAGDRPS